MKTKIMKPLIRGGFILLCLSILGSLLSSSSVLAQEPSLKIGELGAGQSDYIPFDIRWGYMIQGELESEEALRVTIIDQTLKQGVYLDEIVGSFFYVAETRTTLTYHIEIMNPTKETISYTLTYAVVPTELAPGTNSGPGVIRHDLPAILEVEGEGKYSDYIPFEIKVGEMVQGELESEVALGVIILGPTLRKSVDFGKIVGSFFYAAETDGRYTIEITNPTIETLAYTLTYTVLPTELAPGTNSVTVITKIIRSLIMIIFGVLAVGGIIYLFIRRKKKKREFESKREAFRKRTKMTE